MYVFNHISTHVTYLSVSLISYTMLLFVPQAATPVKTGRGVSQTDRNLIMAAGQVKDNLVQIATLITELAKLIQRSSI